VDQGASALRRATEVLAPASLVPFISLAYSCRVCRVDRLRVGWLDQRIFILGGVPREQKMFTGHLPPSILVHEANELGLPQAEGASHVGQSRPIYLPVVLVVLINASPRRRERRTRAPTARNTTPPSSRRRPCRSVPPTTPCRMTGVTLRGHVHYKEIYARTCSGPLIPSVTPLAFLTAPRRRGNNFKRCKDFYLKAKAITWSCLSYISRPESGIDCRVFSLSRSYVTHPWRGAGAQVASGGTGGQEGLEAGFLRDEVTRGGGV